MGGEGAIRFMLQKLLQVWDLFSQRVGVTMSINFPGLSWQLGQNREH